MTLGQSLRTSVVRSVVNDDDLVGDVTDRLLYRVDAVQEEFLDVPVDDNY